MCLGIFVQNRIGIIDMNQHFAIDVKAIQQADGTVGSVYRHVAHLTAQTIAKAFLNHFVIEP